MLSGFTSSSLNCSAKASAVDFAVSSLPSSTCVCVSTGTCTATGHGRFLKREQERQRLVSLAGEGGSNTVEAVKAKRSAITRYRNLP